MEGLFGFIVFICLCTALIGGLAALVRRANFQKSIGPIKVEPNWQPPKNDALPYKKKNYIFSEAERSFYEIIRRVLPDHTVFAKVRLADLVYVSGRTNSFQSHFNRISRKHVDFAICDQNLMPVLVIELDDSSHKAEGRKTRDEFVDEVLKAAAVPILRVPARRGYVLDDLRRLITPYVLPASHP